MKHIFLIAALAASPAAAQDTEEGLNLIEEGAKLFLRGLMSEMEPAIEDFQNLIDDFGPAMQEFALEMGPVLSEMLERVDDFRHYSQPEFLPNGDIIIRRKPTAPRFDPPPMDEITEGIEL